MHTYDFVEGQMAVQGHDWIRDRQQSNCYVRLGGYMGARTAELVETSIGWVGQTWMLTPSRTAVLSPGLSLGEAIHRLEAAENQGHDAAVWIDLPAPPPCLGTPRNFPGEARHWTRMENGHSVTIIEVTGDMGVPHYLVAIDGVLMTGRDGKQMVYDNLSDAQYDAYLEAHA